jgi:hypothetical protein
MNRADKYVLNPGSDFIEVESINSVASDGQCLCHFQDGVYKQDTTQIIFESSTQVSGDRD